MAAPPDGAVKPLFSAEAIARRVDQLARDIAHAGLDDPIIVAVLKGSFIFAADLVRALHRAGLRPEIDFISLASYDGAPTSKGDVRVLHDVETEGYWLRQGMVGTIVSVYGSGAAYAIEFVDLPGGMGVVTLRSRDVDGLVE